MQNAILAVMLVHLIHLATWGSAYRLYYYYLFIFRIKHKQSTMKGSASFICSHLCTPHDSVLLTHVPKQIVNRFPSNLSLPLLIHQACCVCMSLCHCSQSDCIFFHLYTTRFVPVVINEVFV